MTDEKVCFNRSELLTLYNAVDELEDLLAEMVRAPGAEIPSEPVTDPDIPAQPITEEAWRCYLARYPAVKKKVEGRSQAVKQGYTKAHYERWGRANGLIWGCSTPIIDESPAATHPHIASAGSGMLWKPIAESRGGVPVALTPPSWNQVTRVRLFHPNGAEVNIPGGVEERGRTNGNRETYFFMGLKASQLPANLVVDFAQHGKYTVPDPTQRYD